MTLVLDLAGYSILGLAFSALLIAVATYLLVKRRISPQLYILWFLIGGIAAVVSIAPGIISFTATILGTQYVISAVSITSTILLLSLVLYLFYRVDRLTDKVMKLTAVTSSLRAVPRAEEKDVEDE